MSIACFVMVAAISPSQNPIPIKPAAPPVLIRRGLVLPIAENAQTQPATITKDQTSLMKPGLPGDGPPVFEIRTADESSIRASILDSTLELTTNFGPLVIPVKDVRKMEVGTRITDDELKQVLSAIAKLTDADRKTRLLGREAVLALAAKALPSVRRAKKEIIDPEILAGVVDVESRIVSSLREKGDKEIADRDTIQTDGSTFVGIIVASHLKVLTGPFGEQKLKVSDIRSGRSLSGEPAEDEGELVNLPPNGMQTFQGQFGKVYRIRVTGVINGNVWGSDVYTLDSYLPMAAVHAGVVKLNETAIVKIKIIQSPNVFASTSQNGVNSMNYGQYPFGAFEFIKKKD